MLPWSWANLMTSACWAVTERITSSCCPWVRSGPLGVGDALGLGVGWLPDVWSGLERSPRTCMPWRSTLTLVLLRPATTVIELSCGLSCDDRERVAGEADDQVDVVAGLDDGADAGDLVDLDGDRALARRDLDVADRAVSRR